MNFKAVSKNFINVVLKKIPRKKYFVLAKDIQFSISSKEQLSDFEKSYLPEMRKIEKKVLRNNTLNINCCYCGMNTSSIVRSGVFLGKNPSLREGTICSQCNLNSRARLIYEFIKSFAKSDSSIYMNEQHTLFSNLVKKNYTNTICSSFTDSSYLNPGDSFELNHRQYRFEDFTRTSFVNNFFDLVVTCDVLEHVPNYKQALNESFRILKPGGTLLLQVPVFGGLKSHNVRAVFQDGEVKHLLAPEMHGDPNSPAGILAFYNFSFDLLKDLKDIGFSRVLAEVYHSAEKGYFTDNHPHGIPFPTTTSWGIMLPVIISATK